MEVPSNNWKVLLLLSVIVPVSFLASFKLAGVIREPQIIGGVKYPLMLTISLEKTTFSLGEPINISYCLTNVGTETLMLSFADGLDYFFYSIYSENGAAVFELYGYIAFPAIYAPEEFHSGGTCLFAWEWKQNFRVFVGWDHNPPFATGQVPAGKYSVIGLFVSHTLGITVETPPKEITIAGG